MNLRGEAVVVGDDLLAVLGRFEVVSADLALRRSAMFDADRIPLEPSSSRRNGGATAGAGEIDEQPFPGHVVPF